MKRFLCILGALIAVMPAFSATPALPDPAEAQARYTYNNTVLAIPGTGAPYETEDSVVFTARPGSRFIGIAFDFEGYKQIHKFRIRNTRDIDGKITQTLMFYVLDRPKYIDTISYRLIVDGMWTTDPLNPDVYYDENTGILLSRFTFSSPTPPETTVLKDNSIHFVYVGKSGQKIQLGGTFTNWDPWIYELQETAPGFYEITLPLPAGTYYYNYFVGMKAVTDKTNPKRAYTPDGRVASVITVN